MIAVVDYGMGNLRSVQKGLERVGHQAEVTSDHQKITSAAGVVLPGVGAFARCMENLRKAELISPLLEVIEQGKPFLGICLGMQLLFTVSEEFGQHPGLGVLKGRVIRFNQSLTTPHMGWNTISIKKQAPHLKGIDSDAYVYFVHSYYVLCEEEDFVCTTTPYGGAFASSIWKDNIFACQFHPEKSQAVGLQILKNFGELVKT